MAHPNTGPRGLNLNPGTVTIWANAAGTFAASTDPDCPFIIALHGAAETTAQAALAAHHRPTT